MNAILLAALAAATPITAPGPQGALTGTLAEAGAKAPVVLIIPGSGPTDRDGNNPLGVTAAPYRLLAEALAGKGVATVRIDKRGMFGSKAAAPDANAVTVADYAADTQQWVEAIRQRTGAPCVWVLGHSEGGLVALASAQSSTGICGLILVAAPGRPLGIILREQLKANPANAPILDDASKILTSLEGGKAADVSAMHPALQTLFGEQVQPFLIDLLAQRPAELAGRIDLPMLIIHGGRDLQVAEADARALAAGQPKARLVVIPEMNHVLKPVASDDRGANLAAYADSSLPVDPRLVEAIAGFVRR